MISQKEEMRTGTESSGVVLHDMIERIYFYFIIFSQKRNGKRETHGRRGSSWKKRFEILQNIQDRSTLEKHVKRARDPISTITKNEKPNESIGTQTKSTKRNSNISDILDVNKQLK